MWEAPAGLESKQEEDVNKRSNREEARRGTWSIMLGYVRPSVRSLCRFVPKCVYVLYVCWLHRCSPALHIMYNVGIVHSVVSGS